MQRISQFASVILFWFALCGVANAELKTPLAEQEQILPRQSATPSPTLESIPESAPQSLTPESALPQFNAIAKECLKSKCYLQHMEQPAGQGAQQEPLASRIESPSFFAKIARFFNNAYENITTQKEEGENALQSRKYIPIVVELALGLFYLALLATGLSNVGLVKNIAKILLYARNKKAAGQNLASYNSAAQNSTGQNPSNAPSLFAKMPQVNALWEGAAPEARLFQTLKSVGWTILIQALLFLLFAIALLLIHSGIFAQRLLGYFGVISYLCYMCSLSFILPYSFKRMILTESGVFIAHRPFGVSFYPFGHFVMSHSASSIRFHTRADFQGDIALPLDENFTLLAPHNNGAFYAFRDFEKAKSLCEERTALALLHLTEKQKEGLQWIYDYHNAYAKSAGGEEKGCAFEINFEAQDDNWGFWGD